MLRRVIGAIIGLAVAMLTITLVEALGHQLFPPPPGTDMSDPAAISRVVDQLPFGAKAMVVLAWFAGALAGAAAGLAIARWRAVPWIVAGGVILSAVANYAMIPHPLWMQAAGILLPLLAAWISLRLLAVRPGDRLSA